MSRRAPTTTRKIERRLAVAGAFALAAAALAAPASAHHSFAMFDQKRSFTVEGTVAEFQFTNPHAWLSVKGADGKAWDLELNSVVHLRRAGWKPRELKAGDKVKVVFHPMRDGSAAGQLREITMPDGRVLSGQGGPLRAAVAAN